MELRWAWRHSQPSLGSYRHRPVHGAGNTTMLSRLQTCMLCSASHESTTPSTSFALRSLNEKINTMHFTSGDRIWNSKGANCHFGNRGKIYRVFDLKKLDSRLREFTVVLCLNRSEGNEQKSRAKPVGASDSPTPPSSVATKKTTLSAVLNIPMSIWRQVLQPLSNFGFGKTSTVEGGVGLFVMAGVVLLAISISWVKGLQLRSRSRKYETVFEFAKAQGITVGTSVRIRGVDVGSVVGVRPSLERIDVVVQLVDTSVVIPRNSLVEVNQSGLISETLIDITPQLPIPQPKVGPLDAGCLEEGLIVCDKERIKGEQGVSLDELIGICTKIARQIGDLGVDNMFDIAQKISLAVEEAKPLLAKVELLAGDVEPLVKELRTGSLLKDLERLTQVATDAGHDLRKLNNSVLTVENTELLRQSVATLTKTLKHIEHISGDVSGLTGDAGTKKNLRQLIESLSRLVMD